MIRAGILCISDKGARGEREDNSGKAIEESIVAIGAVASRYAIIPDEKEVIAARLAEWADGGEVDLILTTGGTGFGPRDVTPEATSSVIEKVTPGFAEAMRLETFRTKPAAILSRATSGIRGRCLIINLPGSPQAVRECLGVILPALPHAVEILRGEVQEHVAPRNRGEGATP